MNFPRHEPTAYSCPFCRVQRGEFDERNKAEDIIAVTDRAYARIAPKWWPANPGAALVIPRVHVENLYEISAEDGHAVWDLTQRVARAMRTSIDCAGTSIRQHNEPAGDQDLWHLHVHVFPRHDGDDLYRRHDQATWVTPEQRLPFARALRSELGLPTTFE